MGEKRRLGIHEVNHPGGSGGMFHSSQTTIVIEADATPPKNPRRRRPLRKPGQFQSKASKIAILLSIVLALGVLVVYPIADIIIQAQRTVPPSKQHKVTTVAHPTVQLTTVQVQTSQQKSVEINASGHMHFDATTAHGTLVFYNSAPKSQTVSKGLTFSGSGGTQVVLLETIVVPAGNLPDVGEAEALAQAVTAGHAGNIPANGINGLCCGSSQLAVKNLAFTGGRDSQDYTYLSVKDVNQAAIPLRTQVGLEALAELSYKTAQYRPVSLAPSTCHGNISSNPIEGTPTQTATITAEVTCEQEITIQT